MTPSPPVTVPSGQSVAWCPPVSVVYGPEQPTRGVPYTNGSATASLSSASFSMTSSSSSHPEDSRIWGAQWNGFNLGYVPYGATIHAAYSVIVFTASTDNALVYASTLSQPGINVPINVLSVFDSGGPANMTPILTSPGSANNLETASNNYLILPGATVADLPNIQVGARLSCSGNISSLNDSMSVSFVGLAVYYTASGQPHQPLVSVSLGTSNAISYIGGL